jgi:NAD(P)-dependent dehydrogenase (short-subunit alcohol dehydrogenase family)
MTTQNGRIVLITGGTGNLGRGVAYAFAAQGAHVALIDRDPDRLAQTAGELPTPTGAQHAGFAADLGQPEGVEAAFEAVLARFGRIDSVIHTVGGYAAGQPVHQSDVRVLDDMLALNTRPVFLVGGAAARHMLARGGGGQIVFILAKAGLKGGKNAAAYTASKGAAIRLMEAMAAELREHAIAVNGISPSTIDTPANRQAMPNAIFDHWVTPAQIAAVCLLLCSPESGLYGANIELFGRGG